MSDCQSKLVVYLNESYSATWHEARTVELLFDKTRYFTIFELMNRDPSKIGTLLKHKSYLTDKTSKLNQLIKPGLVLAVRLFKQSFVFTVLW